MQFQGCKWKWLPWTFLDTLKFPLSRLAIDSRLGLANSHGHQTFKNVNALKSKKLLDDIHSLTPPTRTNDWLRKTDLMPSGVEGKLSHIIIIIIHISTSGETPSGWRQCVVTLPAAAIQGSYAESFGAFVAATEGSHLEAMIWMHLAWWVWEVFESAVKLVITVYVYPLVHNLSSTVHFQDFKQPWTQLGPWSKAGHPSRPLSWERHVTFIYFYQFLCRVDHISLACLPCSSWCRRCSFESFEYPSCQHHSIRLQYHPARTAWTMHGREASQKLMVTPYEQPSPSWATRSQGFGPRNKPPIFGPHLY